ncbi:MAG: aminoacetone oxidase family FAD-binding enzyme, partial [Candidatus Coatesbacteria bacterium]|nr:aminoacetone oxidase family FAD-binding enzyme [Candidatus Coatesbacteria bacterium]
AAATLGGVDTGEVDPRRLESRLRLGLHFAGEVLDICGECGGFNLQWAWSSGFVAGESAAAGR